jgi:hypothetical protein
MLVILISLAVSAQAKDIALILDEAAQRDLIAVLDAARKQVPDLNIVEPVARTWQRLKAAPEVTAHTEDKPSPPPAAVAPAPVELADPEE